MQPGVSSIPQELTRFCITLSVHQFKETLPGIELGTFYQLHSDHTLFIILLKSLLKYCLALNKLKKNTHFAKILIAEHKLNWIMDFKWTWNHKNILLSLKLISSWFWNYVWWTMKNKVSDLTQSEKNNKFHYFTLSKC